MKIKSLILLLCFSLTLFANGEIKVASILGNNMVLQRNTEVKLWGNANKNEELNISVGWSKIPVSVKSDKTGKWLAKIKTTEAGDLYKVTISNLKEKIIFI